MQHYNKYQKCCATCVNWCGLRTVTGTNIKQVEVASSNESGRCADNLSVGGFVYGLPRILGKQL